MKDDADLDARHGEYRAAIVQAARAITQLTDVLLFGYWRQRGIEAVEEPDKE